MNALRETWTGLIAKFTMPPHASRESHSHRIRFFLVGMALPLVLAAAAQAREALPQFDRIDAAEANGLIDADQALLYRFQYAFGGEQLPAEYRPDVHTPIKCGTQMLLEFEQLRSRLRPETVKIIGAYLAKPAGDKAVYISAAGHFLLTYGTTGFDAVPPADVSPNNGIPDYVERCASYLETAWSTEIDTWGFAAPLTLPWFPVSFENMPPVGDEGGTYGYVPATGDSIVLENDYVGFPANDDPDGDSLGAAKVTCAHEFKHTSQYRTSQWSEGGWIELDGTWAEELVYPATNDYYNYIRSRGSIFNPSVSLDSGGTGSYEDCIWQLWMSKNWSNSIIVDLWSTAHAAPNMMAAYDAILATRGSSVAAGYPQFAAWNYACGTRAVASLGYSEASTYPPGVAFALPLPFTGNGMLDHLSAANWEFTDFSPGETGTLHIQFNGDNTATMGLVAVIERNDGTGQFETIPLDGSRDADVMLPVRLEDLNRVGIVISNSGITGDNKAYSLTVTKECGFEVSNVQAQQRPGTTLVDVTYDFMACNGNAANIKLFLSTDSGGTFPHLCEAVTGDVGPGVTPGFSRQILWNAGAEFPSFSSATCRLRVTADDAGNLDDFIYVEPGTFTMGSPASEPYRYGIETRRQVTLTRGMYVQTTEVTNRHYVELAQWAYNHDYARVSGDTLVDNLDYANSALMILQQLKSEIAFSNGVFTCINPDRPVTHVNWYGAAAYCDWLSLQQGLPRAYNHSTWQCNAGNPYTATGYRLPTEAEWEYACRAGTQTPFNTGSCLDAATEANYFGPFPYAGCPAGPYGLWTVPVGSYPANAFGLYDMHGNLSEWCNDWYGTYGGGAVTDPVGLGAGSTKLARGGSWETQARYCRSAYRGSSAPYYFNLSGFRPGFRPVRSAN